MQRLSKNEQIENTKSSSRYKSIGWGFWFLSEAIELIWFFNDFCNHYFIKDESSKQNLYVFICIAIIVVLACTAIGVSLCVYSLCNKNLRRIICDFIYIFCSITYLPLSLCHISLILYRDEMGAFLLSSFFLIFNIPIAVKINKHLDSHNNTSKRFLPIWFSTTNLILFCVIMYAEYNFFNAEGFSYIHCIDAIIVAVPTFLMSVYGFLISFDSNRYAIISKYILTVSSFIQSVCFLYYGYVIFPTLLFYNAFNLYAAFNLDTNRSTDLKVNNKVE